MKVKDVITKRDVDSVGKEMKISEKPIKNASQEDLDKLEGRLHSQGFMKAGAQMNRHQKAQQMIRAGKHAGDNNETGAFTSQAKAAVMLEDNLDDLMSEDDEAANTMSREESEKAEDDGSRDDDGSVGANSRGGQPD